MGMPLMPKRKADAISNGIFLICIGILIYTGAWWPQILLAIWALLATRQYLTGRIYDLSITTLILLGLFMMTYFNVNWSILMPVLFVIGGIYIIFREYFYGDEETIDTPEDTKNNIENDK